MPERRRNKVIINTSPLIYLHRIGRLDLLRRMYGRIVICRQVEEELERGRRAGVDVPDVESAAWIERREVGIPGALKLVPDLGPGEAGTIALGLEAKGPVLLVLDDRLARRIAGLHGLPLTGTAGVILKAKKRGLVPIIRPLLEALLSQGFYLRPALVEVMLRIAREAKKNEK